MDDFSRSPRGKKPPPGVAGLNYAFISVTTEGLVNDAATFGECTNVVINITTKTTGTITGTGDNFVSGN